MTLSRRPASAEDDEFARRVHHAAYESVVVRQFGRFNPEEQDRFFERDWEPAKFEILTWNGQPCGYVAVEDREADVHVRELVVAPAFQGRGIGSQVLRDAIELAGRRGVPVRIGALHENRALDLYRRLGFQEVGRTATHTLLELRP